MRKALADWMRRTGDPALEAFEDLGSEDARRQFMADQDGKVAPPKKKRKKKP